MGNSEHVRSVARPSLMRPLPSQGTVEGSKSRLVQPRYSTRSSILVNKNNQPTDEDEPPSPTKLSRGPSGSTKPIAGVSTEGTMPTRLRPRSMYQTASATPQRSDPGAKSNSQSMRPPPPVSKLPEPQTSGLGRTQSLCKPGVASQSARAVGATSHSRAQSVNTAVATSHSRTQPVNTAVATSHSRTQSVNTAVATSHSGTQSVNTAVTTRREITKSGPTSERPNSLAGAPSANSRTNGPSTVIAPSSGSVPGRLAGLRSSASTKVKPETESSSSETRRASRPEEPAVVQAERRDGVPEGTKKTSRPAFSTLQQHFTPRKTGKAATSTFLHPAPVTGPQTLPPEITNLQIELLQLHLLHQSCNDVCKQWELSAKRSFRTRFEEVASLHQTMLQHERAGQEQKNLQSLIEWSSGRSSTGLSGHIQVLSEPLHELPSLVEPGGRLQRLVGEFEHWVSWVQEVRRARQDVTGDMAGSRTIEGLGDSWKAESTALVRKVTTFARALDGLDAPAPGSSLLCIVDSCKALVGGILEELQIMQTVEVDLVTKEKFWVEDRLKLIARAIGTHSVNGDEEIAAWRN